MSEYTTLATEALGMLATKKVLHCREGAGAKNLALWQRRALAHTQNRVGLADWSCAKILQDFPNGWKIEDEELVRGLILSYHLVLSYDLIIMSGADGHPRVCAEAA